MRTAPRSIRLATFAFALVIGCTEDNPADEAESTGETGISTGDEVGTESDATEDATETDATDTGSGECVMTSCQGKVYECGDCIDNDNDGKADVADADCWGPCQNNESGFKGDIPGQNQAPCSHMDCYFDGDSGSGNDACHWSHSCDPSMPNPSDCTYDENSQIPGSSMSCEEAQQAQEPACLEYCGPLVPNGCDCFGCCDIEVDGTQYTIFLGTQDAEGNGTCTLDAITDPEACSPCVQVASCSNDCNPEECEICIGQTELPDDCDMAECPDGVQSCDPQLNSTDCPSAYVCVTGCCYPSPE